MPDFGAKLRQARERRGVSLRQIAASTKISVGVLEALERNDVSKLPGGIFGRSFVRAYATEVGLNADDTVREFVDSFHDVAAIPDARPPVGEDETQFESQRRIAGILLLLIAISVPLGAAILYLTVRARAAATAAVTPPPIEVRTPATQPPALPPADAVAVQPASAQAAVARVDHAANTAPAAKPAVEAAPLTIDLHPARRCWVVFSSDGQRVFAKVMEAGERRTGTASREAVIQVGDAGAFAYSVNGREARPLGRDGEVKTVRLTPDSLSEFIR